MIERIFVDIDGVLNRFEGWLLKAYGIDVDLTDDTYAYARIRGITQLIEQHTGVRYDEKTIWDNLPEWVWSDAPLSAEGHWLLDYCCQLVGPENVGILTKNTQNPNSCSGKLKWVQKHFPKLERQLMIAPCKHLCAHENTLLIDDSDANCAAFNNYGGLDILVPRPWNGAGVMADTRPYLEFWLDYWTRNACVN